MKNKLIILMCIILIAMPLASAQMVFHQGQNADIKIPCLNSTNSYCSNTAKCYLTVLYPNSSLLVNNIQMTNQGSFHNYTISNSSTKIIGEYSGTAQCNDAGGSGYSTFIFYITRDGEYTQNVSYLPIIIALIGGIAIIIIFAMALSKEHEPISILLLFTSLFLVNPLIQTAMLAINNSFQSEFLAKNMGAFQIALPLLMYGIIIYMLIYVIVKLVTNIKEQKARAMGFFD